MQLSIIIMLPEIWSYTIALHRCPSLCILCRSSPFLRASEAAGRGLSARCGNCGEDHPSFPSSCHHHPLKIRERQDVARNGRFKNPKELRADHTPILCRRGSLQPPFLAFRQPTWMPPSNGSFSDCSLVSSIVLMSNTIPSNSSPLIVCT